MLPTFMKLNFKYLPLPKMLYHIINYNNTETITPTLFFNLFRYFPKIKNRGLEKYPNIGEEL